MWEILTIGEHPYSNPKVSNIDYRKKLRTEFE